MILNHVPGALQVYYVVDKPSGFYWKGGVGYITEDMVRRHLPPASEDSLILVRGWWAWPTPQALFQCAKAEGSLGFVCRTLTGLLAQDKVVASHQ